LNEQQLGLALLLERALGSLVTMWLQRLADGFGLAAAGFLILATFYVFAFSLVFPVWAPNLVFLTVSLGFLPRRLQRLDGCLYETIKLAYFEALAGRPLMSSFHAIWEFGRLVRLASRQSLFA